MVIETSIVILLLCLLVFNLYISIVITISMARKEPVSTGGFIKPLKKTAKPSDDSVIMMTEERDAEIMAELEGD